MVFDSSESYMLRLNPNHKVRIKKDITRWDYLLSDSLIAKNIFNTSFDFPKDKILNFGYPRNEWLIKNHDNENLINKLKLCTIYLEGKRSYYMRQHGEIIIIK